ncbi:MAG: PIN domain-containing protein [Pseudomonadota bacterium]
MTTIFIDTNILMNDSFFRSSSAKAFLKACSFLKVQVVVPDIVMDELLGNFSTRLQEKVNAYQKASRELVKLVDLDQSPPDVEAEVSAYEDWLLELIEDNGLTVAPYPDVSAKELVSKSYEGAKPFKDGGEGHKDYLVWKSVAAHINAQETDASNCFLTNNTKDFCAKGDDGAFILHPELAEQVNVEARVPSIQTSLRNAFDNVLAPNLQGVTLEDIPEIGTDEVQAFVDKCLLDDLPQHSAFGFEGVPFSNDVSITSVGEAEIGNIELVKADDEVFIKVSGTVEICVSGFMEKHEFYREMESGLDVSVDDSDWNDHVMAVSTYVDTAFEVRLFYSFESKEVAGYEISLPQEIEDDWPYK